MATSEMKDAYDLEYYERTGGNEASINPEPDEEDRRHPEWDAQCQNWVEQDVQKHHLSPRSRHLPPIFHIYWACIHYDCKVKRLHQSLNHSKYNILFNSINLYEARSALQQLQRLPPSSWYTSSMRVSQMLRQPTEPASSFSSPSSSLSSSGLFFCFCFCFVFFPFFLLSCCLSVSWLLAVLVVTARLTLLSSPLGLGAGLEDTCVVVAGALVVVTPGDTNGLN